MACRDKTLKLYLNDVEMFYPLKVEACMGEVRHFSCSTDLIDPTFRWTLDTIYEAGGLLLSTDDFCDYTFDNKDHRLYCDAKSVAEGCSIVRNIRVIGRDCNPTCPIACMEEFVTIPAGALVSLVDINNKTYKFTNLSLECSKISKNNLKSIEGIKNAIINAVNCNAVGLEVKLEPNYVQPKCLKLTIKNSPIRFRMIKIGELFYSFNEAKC